MITESTSTTEATRRDASALQRGVRPHALKLTRWFPPTERPVRAGVYETDFRGSTRGRWFNRWDGSRWHWGHAIARTAAQKDSPMPGEHLDNMKRWRGVSAA